MVTKNTTEISGNDLAKLVNVSYDEAACLEVANMAARRIAANAHRRAGMSVRASKRAAQSARATAQQQALVTDQLLRGATIEQAVAAVLDSQ